MAIDPRDYEKYSGRKGDPYSRLGSALAGSAEQKARNADAKSRMTGGDLIAASYFYHWLFGGIISLIILVVMLISLV